MNRRQPVEVRLAGHLVRMPNDCLEWTGSCQADGYGRMGNGAGGLVSVHRLSWSLANDQPVPEGKFILHSCDNPPCCEPTHLRVGTKKDNMADCLARGRHGNGRDAITHCPQSHEYDEANTYVSPKGHRQCRKCRKVQSERQSRIRSSNSQAAALTDKGYDT